MKKIKILFLCLFFFLFSTNLYSEKVSILYTVNNSPITNIEVKNEIEYLKLINNNLDDMDENSLVVYASKSILREKIKELEISKYFKFGVNDKIVTQNIEKLIFQLGLSNRDDLNELLLSLGLNFKFIMKKVEIELLWNRLIFEKYKNKLSIDEENIKKNLRIKIDQQKNEIEEYKLSEILFNPISKQTENEEIEKLKKSISEIGFENTAMIYSLSNTASMGGNIGWLKKTQLSEKILKIVENLEIDQMSDVIDAPAGKLILFLKDKRKIKEKISFEKELEKAIIIERNKQLNQFSTIYFRKVELNTNINER